MSQDQLKWYKIQYIVKNDNTMFESLDMNIDILANNVVDAISNLQEALDHGDNYIEILKVYELVYDKR